MSGGSKFNAIIASQLAGDSVSSPRSSLRPRQRPPAHRQGNRHPGCSPSNACAVCDPQERYILRGMRTAEWRGPPGRRCRGGGWPPAPPSPPAGPPFAPRPGTRHLAAPRPSGARRPAPTPSPPPHTKSQILNCVFSLFRSVSSRTRTPELLLLTGDIEPQNLNLINPLRACNLCIERSKRDGERWESYLDGLPELGL
eukprot:1194315-Prorocentrum_minimum.AAC.5